MRLFGQFQACLFFALEKVLNAQKRPNAKQTIFTLLEVFAHAKNCCLSCLMLAYFCFVGSFLLVFAYLTCLCAREIFP